MECTLIKTQLTKFSESGQSSGERVEVRPPLALRPSHHPHLAKLTLSTDRVDWLHAVLHVSSTLSKGWSGHR
eukprot:1687373-Amphidinium_carterae.2